VGLRGQDGRVLELFLLAEDLVVDDDDVYVGLKSSRNKSRLVIVIRQRDLSSKGITVADIREAPALILPLKKGQSVVVREQRLSC
jgi:hypothetical protein